jgi:leucine dehydrogenase
MIFEHPDFDAHERVVLVHDRPSGLRAIIALHHTRHGMPAVGGVRFRSYASESHAMTDALRLSRAMTYKNVLAELPAGGGKSVILGDPSTEKTRELLLAFGRAVEALAGAYLCGPDVGTGPEDMDVIAEETRFVGATTDQMGSTGPPTAAGTFKGLQALTRHTLRRDGLEGVRVAVQGTGAVGGELARLLADAGASIVVADVDPDAAQRVAEVTGAEIVDPSEILFVPADLLAPCALGGVLSRETIPRLRVRGVCGAANNQLERAEDARLLRARGIHLVPDFVASAGGVIAGLAAAGLYPADEMSSKLDGIYQRSLEILARADAEDRTPDEVAIALARERLEPRDGGPTRSRRP